MKHDVSYRSSYILHAQVKDDKCSPDQEMDIVRIQYIIIIVYMYIANYNILLMQRRVTKARWW